MIPSTPDLGNRNTIVQATFDYSKNNQLILQTHVVVGVI
jgi:hypothetical protein